MPAPLVIDTVYFDAVGTVLEPSPPVRRVYLQAGRRHGHEATEAEVGQLFKTAFAHEEERDRLHGLRTCEAREAERWRNIVSTTLPGVRDMETCYQELRDHFGFPDAWRVLPGVAELFSALTDLGISVGMASNFDSRLHGIIRSKPEFQPIRHVVVSSEIGWRKPAEAFFHHLADLADAPPRRILMVGDDPENDVRGPQKVGMNAILVSPGNPRPDAPDLPSLVAMVRDGFIQPGPRPRSTPVA